jgi:hypothetical protein
MTAELHVTHGDRHKVEVIKISVPALQHNATIIELVQKSSSSSAARGFIQIKEGSNLRFIPWHQIHQMELKLQNNRDSIHAVEHCIRIF